MRVELTGEVTVECPYRDNAEDTYTITLIYEAAGPYIKVPDFEQALSKYASTAIAGEDLVVAIQKDLQSSSVNKLLVRLENYAGNVDIQAEAGDRDE